MAGETGEAITLSLANHEQSQSVFEYEFVRSVARNGQREASPSRRRTQAASRMYTGESKECSRCNAPPNELALFCGACMCMLHAGMVCTAVPAVYTCRMYAHTEYKRSHVRGVQTLPTSSNHLLVQFYRGRLNLLERISNRNAPFELIENETKREETIFFRSSKIYIFVFVEINRDARIPDVKGWIAIPCPSDN